MAQREKKDTSGQNKDDDEAAMKLIENSFQEKKSLTARPMIFVKGGTIHGNKEMIPEPQKGKLYMPKNEVLESALKQKAE